MSANVVDHIAPNLGNPLANQPAESDNETDKPHAESAAEPESENKTANPTAQPVSFANAARAAVGPEAPEPKGVTIAIPKTVLDAARAIDGSFPTIFNVRKVPDNMTDIVPGEPLGFYAAQNYENVAAMIADEPRSANRAALFKASKIYFIKVLGSTPLIVLSGLTPQAGQASAAEARTVFVDATAGSCTQEISLADLGLAQIGSEPTVTVTTPLEHTAKVFGQNFSKKRGPFSIGEVPASTANRIVGAHPAITVQMPMQRITTTSSAKANATLKFAYGTDPSTIFQVAKGIREQFYAMPRLGAIRISRKSGDISDEDISKIRATHPEVTACILDVRRPKSATDPGADRRTPQQIQRDLTTDMIVVRTASAVPFSFELLQALAARWKGTLIRGDAASALMRVPKGVVPPGSIRVGSLLVATLLDELRVSRAANGPEVAPQISEEAHDAQQPNGTADGAAVGTANLLPDQHPPVQFENGPPRDPNGDSDTGEGTYLGTPQKIDIQDGEEDSAGIAPSAEKRSSRKSKRDEDAEASRPLNRPDNAPLGGAAAT